MILLFGGTSETAPLAQALAEGGFAVLVSTATSVELDIGRHKRIRRRSGRLDSTAMVALIRQEKIDAIVDAGHPYATALHEAAQQAAQSSAIRLLRFQRPVADTAGQDGLHWVADHAAAAAMAVQLGRKILLTTGSTHLSPYIQAAQANRAELFARVLPEPESLEACLRAGLNDAHIIAARGPFSLEDNTTLLRSLSIDVLVTKESGAAGGLAQKIEAAARHDCPVVIVQRPPELGRAVYTDVGQILHALKRDWEG